MFASSMIDFLGTCAAAGFMASIVLHALARFHAAIPDAAVHGLFLSMLPVFIAALLTHPASRPRLGGASVTMTDGFKAVPAWVQVAFWGSIAYWTVLWFTIPIHHISFLRALTTDERIVGTWMAAPFFVTAFGLRWSSRKLLATP
jgi:hypothetical protein